MEKCKDLIWWLRWMGTGQTGEMTYTRVADAFENIITENAALRMHIENLTDAQAVMVKEFTAKLEELEQVKAERDAAINLLRSMYWCYGCTHLGQPLSANSGCDLTSCWNVTRPMISMNLEFRRRREHGLISFLCKALPE